ncbi:arylamine N-acetyltransferase family protein [Effusibacillus lacus]|uniref:N-hydroxyarylamine O-acetyltransferase n=1 Tax=Effusibacillus lacus TaxID=1348429 RepID=A0A292YN51_9BACL|nr:arylamine N-acetyltransferase [Effusibacillus lacus]TCS72037.1 N-hydroxyarylamine O-acetyltransferase [Effusibacillus lacus]GAX90329.1 N-hydroxyarylamine O-acetyltransferase [Effusibacillus lacus]
MNLEAYLNRIGIEGRGSADLAFLSHLQSQHMLSVPFENLDIHRGIRITLDADRIFQKVVGNRRGGFCYELNGLLYYALRELGYDVTMVSGEVKRKDGTYGPPFDHLALLVHLDRDYLVDVGFGDSVRTPLPMTGEEVEDVSGLYRIQLDSTVPHGYLFQKKIEGEWVAEYRFTTVPRLFEDFADMCEYHQTSPQSSFTQKELASLSTPTGRVTYSGDDLIITEGKEKTRVPIQSDGDKRRILQHYFGIAI